MKGWYDGPITGIALYQGDSHYFRLVNHGVVHDDELYRVYLLMCLTPEQQRAEAYRHDLFREKVGSHWDMRDNGMPYGATYVKPVDTYQEFYDAYRGRPEPDYSQNTVRGWFELAMGSVTNDDADEDES